MYMSALVKQVPTVKMNVGGKHLIFRQMSALITDVSLLGLNIQFVTRPYGI